MLVCNHLYYLELYGLKDFLFRKRKLILKSANGKKQAIYLLFKNKALLLQPQFGM